MVSYMMRAALLALLAGAAVLFAADGPARAQLSGTGFLTTTAFPAAGGTLTGQGTYAVGTVVTVTATPNDGYAFRTWTGACTGTGACSVYITEAGREVRAHFTVVPPEPPNMDPFTLTTSVGPDGGGDLLVRRSDDVVSRVVSTSTHNPGTEVVITARADRGWAFSAWGTGGDNASCGAAETCTLTMSQDRSVTANFVRTHYILTGVASPVEGGSVGGTGLFSSTQSPAPTATATVLTATGYRFGSWSGACTGTGTCSVTMDADKSVTANFIRTHTLTTSVTPAGAGALNHAGGPQDAGTAISLAATPNLGYRFQEWTSDLGGCTGYDAGDCDFTMTTDIAVIAHFVTTPIHTLTVRTTPAAGGSVSGSGGVGSLTPSATGASGSYNWGDVVTLTQTANPGWRFDGWGGACSGTGTTCSVSVTTNRLVTARFARDRLLLLTGAEPFGGGTVSEGGEYNRGAVVPVTATPNPGWRFSHWTSACTGTGTCSITIDGTSPVLVVAHFASTASTVTLRTLAQPARWGTVTEGGDYAPGTAVTLTATPDPGYRFDAWTGGGCQGETAPTCTLTVNYPLQVIARFVDPSAPVPPPAASPPLAPAPAPVDARPDVGVEVRPRVRGVAPDDPSFGFRFTCTEAGSFALAPNEDRRFPISADDSCTLTVTDGAGAGGVSGRIKEFPFTRADTAICAFSRTGAGDLFTDRSFVAGEYIAEVTFDYEAEAETAGLPLAAGVTFIAWPGDGVAVGEALGTFASAVHFWDADGQGWLSWFPGGDALGVNTLTTLRTNGIYAISRRAAFDGWRVAVSDDREAPSVLRLARGTTFIEWRGDTGPVVGALGDRIAAVAAVYSWDAGEQRWLSWFPEGDELGVNTLTGFEPGGIYAISSATSFNWRVLADEVDADELPAC